MNNTTWTKCKSQCNPRLTYQDCKFIWEAKIHNVLYSNKCTATLFFITCSDTTMKFSDCHMVAQWVSVRATRHETKTLSEGKRTEACRPAQMPQFASETQSALNTQTRYTLFYFPRILFWESFDWKTFSPSENYLVLKFYTQCLA